jgi:hypothetical protein
MEGRAEIIQGLFFDQSACLKEHESGSSPVQIREKPNNPPLKKWQASGKRRFH